MSEGTEGRTGKPALREQPPEPVPWASVVPSGARGAFHVEPFRAPRPEPDPRLPGGSTRGHVRVGGGPSIEEEVGVLSSDSELAGQHR
jgi:hypothetical protein